MALGLRIGAPPSDAVVSAAASGPSSAACAAVCSSAALRLFSFGASAHPWCCSARRSPFSSLSLFVGGRAYVNSSSASPAAARLYAGTASPSRWNGPPPSAFAAAAAQAAAVSAAP